MVLKKLITKFAGLLVDGTRNIPHLRKIKDLTALAVTKKLSECLKNDQHNIQMH